MINIEIIAVGNLKKGPMHALSARYQNLIQFPLTITELKDDSKLSDKLDSSKAIWILDEKGKSSASRIFAQDLQSEIDEGQKNIQFVIGGADGLPAEIRNSADKLISFGKQTWPHMLARVMLLEQIYRAQQILKGHPYHRD